MILDSQNLQDTLLKEKYIPKIKITGTKNYVEKEAGKSTYNIGQTITNTGGTLEDVLRKLPNIRVDQSGNISIQGKQNISVWVDGKPSAMAEADLNSFIKSIPAASIEIIEIITNPGSKYDAQGSGGIIHIKLKKEKKKGTNGLISAGYGYPNRCQANFSINKREGPWNIFANYNYQKSYFEHIYQENRTINYPDTFYYYNMLSLGNSPSQSHSFKTGMDYSFKKATISYTLNVFKSYDNYLTQSTGRWFVTDTLLKINTTPNDFGNRTNYSNDITYKIVFDSTGKEFMTSITYNYVPLMKRANFLAHKLDGVDVPIKDGIIDLYNISTNKIQNLIVQLDYTTKATYAKKIEFGIKNESTWNKNNFELNENKNGTYQLNTTYSNLFNYTENISAAYMVIEKALFKNIDASIGFRIENTDIKSNIAVVSRNYFNLFPNIRFTHKLTEMRTMGLALSSRINRPNFNQLNNVVFYNDPYSTWQGNPALRPSTEYIASYNFTDIQNKWMTSIDFNLATLKNKITEGTILDSAGISRSGYYNSSQGYYASLVYYLKFDIHKSVTLQLSNTYTFQLYERLEGFNNSAISGHNYGLWGNLNFNFNKYGQFEFNGWFESGGVNSQGKGFPSGSMDIGYKLNILSHWSVTTNLSNVFNTMNFRWAINNGGLAVNGKWHMLNRALYLTVAYKFGNSNKIVRSDKKMNMRLVGSDR